MLLSPSFVHVHYNLCQKGAFVPEEGHLRECYCWETAGLCTFNCLGIKVLATYAAKTPSAFLLSAKTLDLPRALGFKCLSQPRAETLLWPAPATEEPMNPNLSNPQHGTLNLQPLNLALNLKQALALDPPHQKSCDLEPSALSP